MVKELTNTEIEKLVFNSQQKNYVIDYILDHNIETAKKAILTHIFESQGYIIINFMKAKKIDYCYIHFSFADGKVNPKFFIDDKKDTYPEMFCAKFTHHADF